MRHRDSLNATAPRKVASEVGMSPWTNVVHGPVALHATTIRFDSLTYDFVREEARAAGLPVSQFVREATLMRAVLRAATRDAPGLPRDFKLLAEEVERLARVDNSRG